MLSTNRNKVAELAYKCIKLFDLLYCLVINLHDAKSSSTKYQSSVTSIFSVKARTVNNEAVIFCPKQSGKSPI